MIEKLINKGLEFFLSHYQDDPFTTIIALLIVSFFVFCSVKFFKYIIASLFTIVTIFFCALSIHSYVETRSLEYQLAQQMIAENCTDTIDLELYLKYENITFVNGKQYRYGQNSVDSIKRNYVCHSSKRTYSVDFLLDVYKGRPTLKEQINDLKYDADIVFKLLNNRDNEDNHNEQKDAN